MKIYNRGVKVIFTGGHAVAFKGPNVTLGLYKVTRGKELGAATG